MAGCAPEKGGPSQGRLYQGVAKTDFGYRMLQTMGWCEGKVCNPLRRCSSPLHTNSGG